MDGGGKGDGKGNQKQKGGSQSFLQVLVGLGHRKKCGVREGQKAQHWIKPWPAAPPANPALGTTQIPEFHVLKPEFQQ